MHVGFDAYRVYLDKLKIMFEDDPLESRNHSASVPSSLKPSEGSSIGGGVVTVFGFNFFHTGDNKCRFGK